jgi:cytochrome P450
MSALRPEPSDDDAAELARPPAHVPSDRVFDFDIFDDPRIRKNPQDGHIDLHSRAPDIFWTPRNGGHWIATRYGDVVEIVTTPAIFSSVASTVQPDHPLDLPVPPMDMDPPEQTAFRRLLYPFLSLRAVRPVEAPARELINELIDSLEGRSSCEFKSEIAVPMPVRLFLGIMHFDVGRYRELVGWVGIVLSRDHARIPEALAEINGYVESVIEARRAQPGDDPVSILLASEVDGRRISPRRVRDMCNLLLFAGLDTVTTAMVFLMRYLAGNPDRQELLRNRPAMIPRAVEEMLRRFSFVTMPRRVTRDHVLSGITLREGDTIFCDLSAASNDDRVFPDPKDVDFERRGKPHLAFNTGPHACVGAALARIELKVFLEEWLRRMPNVRLPEDFEPRARGGMIMTLDELPLVW